MLNIKVFSDYACPFCYIGLNLLEKLKKDVEFEDEWYTFEMRPEMPLEGDDFSLKATEEQKEKTEKLYQMLSTLGNQYGVEFLNKYMRFNTKRAHLVGEYAKTQGKYKEFSKEAFKTYFEYTKNLADKEVLNKIANKIGLNIEEMNKQIDEGKFDNALLKSKNLIKQHGVEGAPTFIINDKHKMTGIRGYEQFKSALLEFSK